MQLLVGSWSRNMNDIWKGLDPNFTIMNMVISILQLVIWTKLHLIFFYIKNITLKINAQNFFFYLWLYPVDIYSVWFFLNCNFWILDNCIGATPFGNTLDMKKFFCSLFDKNSFSFRAKINPFSHKSMCSFAWQVLKSEIFFIPICPYFFPHLFKHEF